MNLKCPYDAFATSYGNIVEHKMQIFLTKADNVLKLRKANCFITLLYFYLF